MSELAVGSLSGLAANSYVIDVASGSQLTQPGMVLGVESVIKTDTQSSSVAGGATVTISGLSINYAVSNASNKLLIMAQVGVSGHSELRSRTGLAIADDGTLVGVGTGVGSRTATATGGRTTVNTSDQVVTSHFVQFVHTPGNTATHTYTAEAVNVFASTSTLYINRSENDTDNNSFPRGSSVLTIMEIAG